MMDKFRWHDLRKNPDDLPERGEKVIIKEVCGYTLCEYMGKGRFMEKAEQRKVTIHRLPIAWMHFEPFDVVADENSEATKPALVEKGSGKVWVCPRCSLMFSEESGPENEFCPECGLKFDWAEE